MEGTQRAIIIARTLSVLVGVFGVYLVIGIIFPLWKHFSLLRSPFDIFFLFVFPLPFLAFGCYCVYCGFCLWFKFSSQNLRRILFVVSLIISFLLILFFGHRRDDRIISDFAIPLFMIPAGIFYIFSIKLFLRLLDLPTAIDWAQREKSVRRFFGWFAFFLGSALMNLPVIYLPPEKLAPDDWKSLLHPAFMIGIIALAFSVYKLCVKIALRNKPKESEIST